jgi:hypothetical protein
MRDQYNRHYKNLGGLGPNIGSEDWARQVAKKQKMKEYADKLNNPGS